MKHRRSTLRRRYGRADAGGFASWADVLAYAATGGPLLYKAPMDARPIGLRAQDAGPRRVYTYELKARTIRIWPWGSLGRGHLRTSDPFNATAGHLDRFSKPVGR
jgi:hypothetical protein